MKRNLLKIPQTILDRIKAFDQDDVVAATVKSLRPADIATYAHLGLTLEAGELVIPQPSPPPAASGKFSYANLYGREQKRTDLPKTQKEFGFWAPSWGSGSYHWVSHTREVYHRDFYAPKEVNLTVELLRQVGGTYVVKFAIDQVINRRTPKFDLELLYNLNLLQENVGAADVFVSATTLAEYAATVHVDWVLLPLGEVDDVVAAMLRGKRPVSVQQQEIMKDRVTALTRLKPEAFIAGADGFLRYFGAKFGDDFVVFENAHYGNALYVMYENWPILSQKSRVELLSGPEESFDRIVHKAGWADELKARVAEYRKQKRRAARLL